MPTTTTPATTPKAAACATGCYKVYRNGQWICIRCGN